MLSWNKPIVGGLVFLREQLVRPSVWKYGGFSQKKGKSGWVSMVNEVGEWLCREPRGVGSLILERRDALLECDAVGFGCVMIRRDVFEKMAEPRFERDEDGTGEDFLFCLKAKEAGFPIYADLGCIVGHECSILLDHTHFLAQHAQRKEGQNGSS